ncbi:GTP-binding protein [Paenibacillus arenilitoris]|uniref:TetM/TetW/TetO/TetS family tetracycline resistance ribosomal protection protein n=1 Tax=Paenibacillus arenilitoris TaxID=2772299 RepID=A0A927H7X1_9BACL|nr:TetM/TetW/TetO/TetS family tetracycline resistance ribosomal protection protein [Paenibacillus arenilitoris]MBD2870977.1 TetM/TetW/TetO/TetS family tetracycline resistance ribosomal protection protein [Paenibacillus arenilitoris]
MNKTFGILAHVDAGKTTFTEQLLYHAGSIKKRGRVDHRDAFMDSHEIERQRGITIFADQAAFGYRGAAYFVIDTPGHADFSPEMERAIQAMDFAVIVVSAVEGVEAHTETVWQLLRKNRVPVFFFMNKTDREGADPVRVMEELRRNLTPDLFDMTDAFDGRTMSDELAEWLAERDEELLEQYAEKGFDAQRWLVCLRAMIRSGRSYPCFRGSALQDIGVRSFLEMFHVLTETNYDASAELDGRVYKIRYDDSGTRVTFVKLLAGRMHVRDEVRYGEGLSDKATQLRRYNGSGYEQVQQAVAGELVAIIGLEEAQTGDGIGVRREKARYETAPALRSSVGLEPHVHSKEALAVFRMLEAEDPALNVAWVERLQQIQLHVMGAIQLEVLEHVLQERFKLRVRFGQPEILYKETVESAVRGYGHFEPLRHYAEVHLLIEPALRDSGVSYESACHVEELPAGLQNAVGQFLLEREHHGLLTGSPLTDIRLTLLTGSGHQKHTHGGDFREAAFRALRQGLEKAENVLLEPYYQFKITVDLDHIGRVLTDIQKAHGSFEPPVTEGNKATVTGKSPVATFMDYGAALASFTQGRGRIGLSVAGYDRCHNEQEAIERIGYDKDADPEYTSSSIFCAKGAGYSVRWDEAEPMMHVPRKP